MANRSVNKVRILLAGMTSLSVLTLFYWFSGALLPKQLPAYASSSRQITGMALMLIFLPTYFVIVYFVIRQRSIDLVEQLRKELPNPNDAAIAKERIETGLWKSWPLASAIGIAMGIYNAPLHYAFTQSTEPAIDTSVAFGQILLWLLVGLLLGARIQAASAFNALGKVVRLDLFRLDRLKPIARSGLLDVLAIAGALAFSPLQSLDAQFRWYNYRFALIVAIPGAIFFVLWPLWHLHQRIRDEKRQQLAHINQLIDGAKRDQAHSIQQLEMLLSHQDRIRSQSTWLLSSSLLSRFLLYLVIPPLAWIAAAVVERWVDRFIGN